MNERHHPTEEERRLLRETERKRLLAAVFGDVLPDGTSDEQTQGWGEPDSEAGDDEWLKRQVPPHHG